MSAPTKGDGHGHGHDQDRRHDQRPMAPGMAGYDHGDGHGQAATT